MPPAAGMVFVPCTSGHNMQPQRSCTHSCGGLYWQPAQPAHVAMVQWCREHACWLTAGSPDTEVMVEFEEPTGSDPLMEMMVQVGETVRQGWGSAG